MLNLINVPSILLPEFLDTLQLLWCRVWDTLMRVFEFARINRVIS